MRWVGLAYSLPSPASSSRRVAAWRRLRQLGAVSPTGSLYLLPDVNLKLMPMLKKTLKPGSRIVSHDFDMGDWKADKEEQVMADRTHTIYLWTIKKK